jgi:hypothetical protein
MTGNFSGKELREAFSISVVWSSSQRLHRLLAFGKGVIAYFISAFSMKCAVADFRNHSLRIDCNGSIFVARRAGT